MLSFIFGLCRLVYHYVHKFAGFFIRAIVAILTKLTKLIAPGDPNKRSLFFLCFQIVQIILIGIAFSLSADRYDLFVNIWYTTPPGSVVGVLNMLNREFQGTLSDVFLGDQITWVTVGIQTVFVEWYSGIVERFEENRLLKVLYLTIFTFTIGVGLTAFIRFLFGERGVLGLIRQGSVLYQVV
ncbi:MAG: hypothetical protein IJ751_05020, partial [Oscillospiraceae bacterium]|nr:hypothetical protein [Oscillospiraceae bacterium]